MHDATAPLATIETPSTRDQAHARPGTNAPGEQARATGVGGRTPGHVRRAAEEATYSHAWFIDSQILWQDCFVYMTHALAQTRRINDACRRHAVPIIWTRHGTYGVDDGGPFMRKRVLLREGGLRKNTWGYEILDELAPQPGDRFVEKTRLSAFFKTDLEEILHELGAETVLLTGVLTNQCIGATCKDALYRDFMPVVVEECVGTATPHLHEPALEMIRVGWGQVNTLAATLDELSAFPHADREVG